MSLSIHNLGGKVVLVFSFEKNTSRILSHFLVTLVNSFFLG